MNKTSGYELVWYVCISDGCHDIDQNNIKQNNIEGNYIEQSCINQNDIKQTYTQPNDIIKMTIRKAMSYDSIEINLQSIQRSFYQV